MRFAFANPNVSGPSRANVTKRVGAIARTANVDVEPELRTAGVNTATLASRSKSGFVCSGVSREACLQQIKASGVFGTISSQVGLKGGIGIYVSLNGTTGATAPAPHR